MTDGRTASIVGRRSIIRPTLRRFAKPAKWPSSGMATSRRLAGARDATIPVINFVTHNDNDYTDPSDRVRRNLERSLRAIQEAAAKAALEPIGATIETITDMVLAEPDRTLEFVYT